MKNSLLLLLTAVSALAAVPSGAQNSTETDRWPDGTVIDAWFKDSRTSALEDLGKCFVLTEHGVAADSTVLQTAAIQAVIDKAAEYAAGGSEAVVVVPAGTFLTASIFLRQGVNLYVAKGGKLKGSDRIGDYQVMMTRIEGQWCKYFPAVVNADGLTGVKICGPGTIDGNGLEFWRGYWQRRAWNPKLTNKDEQRPRLLFVSDCKDVEVSGLRFRNSPFWTTHFYKCENVRLLGLDIFAPAKPVRAPSSDAIDIDVCRNVLVKDCYMSVNDDAVVLKGGKGPYADKDGTNGSNEFILIEDCTYGFCHGCLTCGSESIHNRNVILRRIRVDDGQRLLWLKMRPDTPQLYEYISVENITGNVKHFVYIHPWTQYFDLQDRQDIPMSYARNITMSDCKLDVETFFNVEKSDQYELSGFCFRNLDITAKDPDCKRSYVNPFIMENVVVNGKDIGKTQGFVVNYDENKVPQYTLEDPLRFADGRKVGRKDWPARRAEILDIFQREMYGQLPPAPDTLILDTIEQGTTMAGFATRTQVRMWFRADRKGPSVDWLILAPKAAEGPVPTVLMLNYNGNHTVIADKEVLIPDLLSRGKTPMSSFARGSMQDADARSIIPANMILARGYAYVTACYEDVSPDPDGRKNQDANAYTGVFDLWGARDPEKDDNTTSLMAWAWALMRGMDMIERRQGLDASRVLVTGSSRLGKAALLAGAYDERFAVVVPNQTGGGGAPLSKRHFGENVQTEMHNFSHWYCKAYAKYIDNEGAMPFDQHLLLSCVAPRPLMVQGFDDAWYDTKGEFLALKAASPAWKLLGREGLPDVSFPADYERTAIGPYVAYYHRNLAHGIAAIDWQWMLDFADGYWTEKAG